MTAAFPGIHPYLNSLLQTPSSSAQPALWPTFHASHIAYITEWLNQHLPGQYAAFAEQSLQIREDFGPANRPRPDVTIFRHGEAGSAYSSSSLGFAPQPTWEAELIAVMPESEYASAVLVRAIESGVLGRVVARLELLSPANKPGGSHAEAYQRRRHEALTSGTPLIEIDYLHESAPIISGLPAYPYHPDSFPYMIVVSDPRPSWERGRVRVYGFGVADPVAPFALPLDDSHLTVDLGAIYQRTLAMGRWEGLLNYRDSPARLATYNPADQAFIQQRGALLDTSETSEN
jgi:hypothetical protein